MNIAAIASFLWDKTPGLVKWPIVILLFLFWTPLRLREEAVKFVQLEVHAVVDPLEKNRDTEISAMKSDMIDTKAYVRAIGIHLMGESKLEKMSATNGGVKNNGGPDGTK
jgi:hypothetical protein